MGLISGSRLALAGLAATATVATAVMTTAVMAQQESDNRVNIETDWSVFVEDDPVECWAVSQPKQTVNTREGRVVSVLRGEILLFVFHRPSGNVSGQVSFTGGYPFPDNYTATLEIGDEEFPLYTENMPDAEGDLIGWGWPATPEEDARIVAAMKAGAEAKVTALSRRGTTTEDTFSLFGFTAASEDAAQRCSG